MRKLVVLATLLLLAAPLAAQDVAFRVGHTNSSFAEGGPIAESRIGTLIGVDLGLSLAEGLALRPGVFHLGKGADVRTIVQGEVMTRGLALDFLQFALPLQRSFDYGKLSVAFQAGPWFALRSACDVSDTAMGVTSSVGCDESATGLDTASSDIGLVVGLGFSYGISGGASVGMDWLQHAGSTDVLTGPGPDPFEEKTRTRVLALRLNLAL